MTRLQVMDRFRRNIEFSRHVPFRQMARRLELTCRRAMRDRLGTSYGTGPGEFSLAPTPPRPLFAPRRGQVSISRGRFRFSFLNRSIDMDSSIAWTAPGRGAANQLWRMHLHYMEYLEEVGDHEFVGLVDSWLAANSVLRPGDWRDTYNSYTVSLRTVVWMQQLALRAGRLPGEFRARITSDLYRQIKFLERNLETDLGGNHLVKNIKALIWASVYFAGSDAGRWQKKGLGLLHRELSKQILDDGMHFERSVSYHAQVFADLLEIRHALATDPLHGRLDDALARMAQATADLAHPDNGPVLFNDGGLSMAYTPSACLAVYERMFGSRPNQRSVFALKEAGYFGLRNGGAYFIADCGRIGPDELPAHGHGDVLSFEWSVAGERMIVDQGVYEYADGERRQRARAASSHNTLCFEEADQAVFFGAFRCGRRPNVKVLAFEVRDPGFMLEGTHDGFCPMPGRPRHVRRFEAYPEGLLIVDRIEGDPKLAAWLSFLLHPAVAVTCSGHTAFLQRGAAAVQMRSSERIETTPAVWWPDMGAELPSQRLMVCLPPGTRGATTNFEIIRRAATSNPQ